MIESVLVGHWSDPVARTGCTVVHFPEAVIASGEVRGGSPASREFALLEPARLVDRIDAVVLSGGSAFGLAAADGVVQWCEEHGRGFPTGGGLVPIVIGLGLFDLMEGDASVRPGAAEGRAACQELLGYNVAAQGRVGAGTGATVDKTRGREHARPGGLGIAHREHGGFGVVAIMAVNSFGRVVADGEAFDEPPPTIPGDPFANTTIGVVVTDARLTKAQCHLVAQSAHDGLARAIHPAHTIFDGDAIVAAATGEMHHKLDPPELEAVRHLAALATADAIRAAVA